MRFFICSICFLFFIYQVRAQTLQSPQFKIEDSHYSVDTDSNIDSSSYSIASERDSQTEQSFDKNGYVARSDISIFRFKLDSSMVNFDSVVPGLTAEKKVNFSFSSDRNIHPSVFLQQMSPFFSFGGISIPDNLFTFHIEKNSASFQLKIPSSLPQGSYSANLNLTVTAGY